MKKLSVGFILVAGLMVAGAVPAGAVAAHTLPLVADCGDGAVTFNIIEGEGSLVGFDDQTGRPVVLHGADGEFIVQATIDDDPTVVDSVAFPEEFLKGMGKGLQLTECEVDPDFAIEVFTLPLNDETAALILGELGIVVDPAAGDEITLISTFEGVLMVQFPGR